MYRDITSFFGEVDGLSLNCEGDSAILNGFINILNTLKDSDNISERPFRPNLGVRLLQILQDPIDDTTAFQLKLELLEASKQFSRASLDMGETMVTPNIPDYCFEVKLVLIDNVTGNKITGFFNFSGLLTNN